MTSMTLTSMTLLLADALHLLLAVAFLLADLPETFAKALAIAASV